MLEEIADSGADLMLSSLVGIDAVRFERAMHDAGLRNGFHTLATNVDQSVLEHIGEAESLGIWSAQEYFMPTLADEMDDVARRYRARFGQLAPRLSGMGKAAYDAIYLYAQAAQEAKTTDPAEIERTLRSGRAGASRLLARDRGAHLPTPLVEVTQGGVRQHLGN